MLVKHFYSLFILCTYSWFEGVESAIASTCPVTDRYECGSGDFQNLIAKNVNTVFCGPIGVGKYMIDHFRTIYE